MQKIKPDDITHILTTIFCTNNYNAREKNEGGINKLVQNTIRTKKLHYTKEHKFQTFYTEIDEICAALSEVHYAGDERCRFQHYEPMPLDLWELPIIKLKPKNTRKHYIKHSGTKRQRPSSSRNQNPYHPKRQRSSPSIPYHKTPNNQTPSKQSLCFRCGKLGHKAGDCWAR